MRLGGVLAGLLLLTVASAASAADDEPICADRPGKANPSCTVPAGDVQIETGLVDWAHARSDGMRSDALTIGATAIKFGLTDQLHIELDLAPYAEARARIAGLRDSASGIGDSRVAMKYRFTGASSPLQAALYPFVKLPTANHSLGNGKVEGGLALLVDSNFSDSVVGWDVAPEVDIVADSIGPGYHLAIVQVMSVGVTLSDRFSVSGDLWGQWDFDPAGTVRQFSLDGAAAYLLSDRVQLDVGANLGLNRDTPNLELYSGIAVRF